MATSWVAPCRAATHDGFLRSLQHLLDGGDRHSASHVPPLALPHSWTSDTWLALHACLRARLLPRREELAPWTRSVLRQCEASAAVDERRPPTSDELLTLLSLPAWWPQPVDATLFRDIALRRNALLHDALAQGASPALVRRAFIPELLVPLRALAACCGVPAVAAELAATCRALVAAGDASAGGGGGGGRQPQLRLRDWFDVVTARLHTFGTALRDDVRFLLEAGGTGAGAGGGHTPEHAVRRARIAETCELIASRPVMGGEPGRGSGGGGGGGGGGALAPGAAVPMHAGQQLDTRIAAVLLLTLVQCFTRGQPGTPGYVCRGFEVLPFEDQRPVLHAVHAEASRNPALVSALFETCCMQSKAVEVLLQTTDGLRGRERLLSGIGVVHRCLLGALGAPAAARQRWGEFAAAGAGSSGSGSGAGFVGFDSDWRGDEAAEAEVGGGWDAEPPGPQQVAANAHVRCVAALLNALLYARLRLEDTSPLGRRAFPRELADCILYGRRGGSLLDAVIDTARFGMRCGDRTLAHSAAMTLRVLARDEDVAVFLVPEPGGGGAAAPDAAKGGVVDQAADMIVLGSAPLEALVGELERLVQFARCALLEVQSDVRRDEAAGGGGGGGGASPSPLLRPPTFAALQHARCVLAHVRDCFAECLFAVMPASFNTVRHGMGCLLQRTQQLANRMMGILLLERRSEVWARQALMRHLAAAAAAAAAPVGGGPPASAGDAARFGSGAAPRAGGSSGGNFDDDDVVDDGDDGDDAGGGSDWLHDEAHGEEGLMMANEADPEGGYMSVLLYCTESPDEPPAAPAAAAPASTAGLPRQPAAPAAAAATATAAARRNLASARLPLTSDAFGFPVRYARTNELCLLLKSHVELWAPNQVKLMLELPDVSDAADSLMSVLAANVVLELHADLMNWLWDEAREAAAGGPAAGAAAASAPAALAAASGGGKPPGGSAGAGGPAAAAAAAASASAGSASGSKGGRVELFRPGMVSVAATRAQTVEAYVYDRTGSGASKRCIEMDLPSLVFTRLRPATLRARATAAAGGAGAGAGAGARGGRVLERLLPDAMRFAKALDTVRARLVTYAEGYEGYRKRERGRKGGASRHTGHEPLAGDVAAAGMLARAMQAASGARVAIEFQDNEATYRASNRHGF